MKSRLSHVLLLSLLNIILVIILVQCRSVHQLGDHALDHEPSKSFSIKSLPISEQTSNERKEEEESSDGKIRIKKQSADSEESESKEDASSSTMTTTTTEKASKVTKIDSSAMTADSGTSKESSSSATKSDNKEAKDDQTIEITTPKSSGTDKTKTKPSKEVKDDKKSKSESSNESSKSAQVPDGDKADKAQARSLKVTANPAKKKMNKVDSADTSKNVTENHSGGKSLNDSQKDFGYHFNLELENANSTNEDDDESFSNGTISTHAKSTKKGKKQISTISKGSDSLNGNLNSYDGEGRAPRSSMDMSAKDDNNHKKSRETFLLSLMAWICVAGFGLLVGLLIGLLIFGSD